MQHGATSAPFPLTPQIFHWKSQVGKGQADLHRILEQKHEEMNKLEH
jgi:hypothetical protein